MLITGDGTIERRGVKFAEWGRSSSPVYPIFKNVHFSVTVLWAY